VPVAVVFLLRAAVLILLWGFVIAAVVAVRHDVFSERTPPTTLAPAAAPPPQPAPPAPAKPSRAARRAGRRKGSAPPTRVVVVDGPATGASVALSSLPITIGRADDATIVLVDDYVSNHHARLIPRGKDWLVEDTGSTNGTFIGDTKVSSPVVVPAGTRIRIGRNILELQ
jgi:pSer/pThr/pTyr-binding forkhead associated (FHA) protein